MSSQPKKQYVWSLRGDREHDMFKAVKQVKGLEVVDKVGDDLRGQRNEDLVVIVMLCNLVFT